MSHVSGEPGHPSGVDWLALPDYADTAAKRPFRGPVCHTFGVCGYGSKVQPDRVAFLTGELSVDGHAFRL